MKSETGDRATQGCSVGTLAIATLDSAIVSSLGWLVQQRIVIAGEYQLANVN